MGYDRLGTVLAVAVAVAWATAAHGFSTGITSNAFPSMATACNFCHGGGVAPTVTLECLDCDPGPTVDPLSAHTFKLTVFEIGLQDNAGLNVSSLVGTLATGGAFAAGTQALVGTGGRQEITHTMPKPVAAGMAEFSFLWTAPNSPGGSASLLAWGNAVNGNGSSGGDAATSASLNVSISGDPPTPTDTPPPPNTPTPTNTPTATVPPTCPPAVDAGCVTGFGKGILSVKEDVPGKEKLVAKLLKGPALAQTDMGNPLDPGQGGTGTVFSLCLYAGTAALAGGVHVDRAGDTCDGKPCWKSIGPAPNAPNAPGKGYRYKDGDLAADGVLKVLYKGGDAGKSKALLIGKGAGLPSGIPAALSLATDVTMQLRSSDGTCLSVTLTDITKQDPLYFKAK